MYTFILTKYGPVVSILDPIRTIVHEIWKIWTNFEQFVDQDLAGKAMGKNKPFAGLNEKDDMRKAKKKIIDRVNYIQRRRHRRKDETVGFSEKQPEGWTLDYIPLPTKKQYK